MNNDAQKLRNHSDAPPACSRRDASGRTKGEQQAKKVPRAAKARRWVAIASFLETPFLLGAVRELSTLGPKAKRLCLIAAKERIDDLRVDTLAASALKQLLARMTEIKINKCRHSLLATSGLFSLSPKSKKNLPLDLLDGLEDRIRPGAALLFVHISSAEDIVDVTRVLLKYSSHHVQTREIPA